MRLALSLFIVGLVASACGPIEPVLPPLEGLVLTLITENLEEPAGLTSPPDDDRLFIIERFGRIRVVADGELLDTPALDLTANTNIRGEKGLTGFAFHPDFSRNQKVYVLHNDSDGNSRLLEYRMSPVDPNVIDEATVRLVLELAQDDFFHQAGYIVFGPEGNLWVTFGDGGPRNDPDEHGQNPRTLHSAVLRLDVDAQQPYGIPAGNPFADGVGGAPEVWAYGFRNPWRIAVDGPTDMVYIADVGQWSFEEINITPLAEPGKNYGWSIREGESCFEANECVSDGLTSAAFIYGRDVGCAVIGGPVYRGTAIPELSGAYFYGDHCVGWIHSLTLEGERITDQADWTKDLGAIPNLMSFGTDRNGEMYVMQRGGRVYRIDPVRKDNAS